MNIYRFPLPNTEWMAFLNSFYYFSITYYRLSGNIDRVTIEQQLQIAIGIADSPCHLPDVYGEVLEPLAMRQSLPHLLPIDNMLNVIILAPVWCVSRTCFASVSPLSRGRVYT